MKIKIKLILLIFIVIGLLGIFIFNNIQTINLEGYFVNVLNGKDISESSIGLQNIDVWSSQYQKDTFYLEDESYILINDYQKFLEYCDSRVEYDKNLISMGEDEMYNGEDEINSNPLDWYYNIENKEPDKRVRYEDNKLVINIKDLSFENNKDIIYYNHFVTILEKQDFVKKSIVKAQEDMSVEFVGKIKEDGRLIYVYCDKDSLQTIKIAVNTLFSFVISCEIV